MLGAQAWGLAMTECGEAREPTALELFAMACEGAIDIVLDATPDDLELLDEYAEIGWRLLPCSSCIVRIGGPFDEG